MSRSPFTRYAVEARLTTKVHLTLSEEEAEALDVLFSYNGGAENFVKVFMANMGTHYLEPHVNGIYSLAETLKQVRSELGTLKEARELLRDKIYKNSFGIHDQVAFAERELERLKTKLPNKGQAPQPVVKKPLGYFSRMWAKI